MVDFVRIYEGFCRIKAKFHTKNGIIRFLMVEHGPVKTKKHTHTNDPGKLFLDNLWFCILAYITTSEFQLPLCFCYFYQLELS